MRRQQPEERKELRESDGKICCLCDQLITGIDYDLVLTKRGTRIYLHKGMRCRKQIERRGGGSDMKTMIKYPAGEIQWSS